MKLPRLQLHLSTLLVVTLLAAGLVWLNVRADHYGCTVTLLDGGLPIYGDLPEAPIRKSRWGWPCACMQWFGGRFDFDGLCLLIDVAANVSSLAVATIATEWLTRHMKRGAA